MKRTFLISSTLAGLSLIPTLASAEPGILYVPDAEVTLQPADDPTVCSGVNAPNSAVGCTANVDAATPIPPFGGDLGALMEGLQTSLEPYDVLVTHERPPEYIAYTMLLPEVPFESPSVSCSFGGINCGARKRNGIAFMVEQTPNCMMPDVLHAALYAFGRAAGLEGVANPMDVMNFPPDFTMPVYTFLDECSFRVRQVTYDDAGMVSGEALNLDCTSLDHVGMCPGNPEDDDAPGQNSHLDLLEYYGDRTMDADPPEITNVVPADGTVLMEGETLTIDADIADADPIAGARWTITSPALMELIGQETFTQCTNDVCDQNWADSPFKATDSDWSVTFMGLLPGEYAITLEAADYHGNVAEMVSFTVTIEGAEGGTTGGGMDSGGNVDDTGGNVTNGGGFESTGDDGDDDDTGSGQDDSGSGSGCSCRTTPAPGGAMLMLLGLVGLGTLRRRG